MEKSFEYSIIESAIGDLFVASTPRGLVKISFESDVSAEVARLEKSLRATGARSIEPFGNFETQLQEYFAGDRQVFSIPLDQRLGTDFQKKVHRFIATIPYGFTVTYGDIAKAIGKPKAFQAIGSACGANPLPIVVPCHRVVSATGMGGFAGGLERKRKLFIVEGLAV